MEESAKWRMVAGFVAVALLAFLALRGPGSSEGPREPVRISAGPPASRPGGRASLVYVHVAGEVRRPGLFKIPRGSRVARAVDRAGGPTSRAQLTAVNLAQRVIDGQQVIVPRAGQAAPAATGSAGPGQPGAPEAPVSLATATTEQLDELDGIGPTLAERIVEFRDEIGGFRSVGQLQEVEGIGEKRFAALKEAVVP